MDIDKTGLESKRREEWETLMRLLRSPYEADAEEWDALRKKPRDSVVENRSERKRRLIGEATADRTNG